MPIQLLPIPPAAVSVGVATTVVLAANTARRGLVLVNDSAATIYISLNGDAVIGSGIRLNANGGAYEMTLDNLSTQAINAIATAAASNLAVQEMGS